VETCFNQIREVGVVVLGSLEIDCRVASDTLGW
jgi:hypothetical protein